MNEAVKTMLARYTCKSMDDYENALKEIIQEISLLGLWRSKFFERASMYGGSALRILYGLDRFSEDLDFSLYQSDKSFSLSSYTKAIEDELKAFGFHVDVQKKIKNKDSAIESAFIKAGTLQNMVTIDVSHSVIKALHARKVMKVKIEVDIDPPGDFETEAKYLFLPIPFSISTYTLPCLFAGKVHAVLCRSWGTRVKGRDWYDLAWYVARDVPVDLKHLEKRMRQTGQYKESRVLDEATLRMLLMDKIHSIDFRKAIYDVEKFLKDASSIKVWSKEYFEAVCKKVTAV